MNTFEEDPFSDLFNTIDTKEISIDDINLLDLDVEEWCENVDEENKDDPTILEVAIEKILETVSPASFWHMLCPSCGECFKSIALWQQHIDEVHFFYNFAILSVNLTTDGQHYTCKKCPAVFGSIEYRKIRQHSFTHMHYKNYYKCSMCEHLMLCEKAMVQHVKRHMEVHLLKAKVDQKILRSKKYQLTELLDYEKFLIYVCPECQLLTRTYDAWHRHVTTKHALFAPDQLDFDTKHPDDTESPTYVTTTCNVCSQSLVCLNLLTCQQKHYLTHLHFRSFRCGLCGMHFNYRNEIKLHMVLLHCKNRTSYENAILPLNMRTDSVEFDLHYKFFTNIELNITRYVHFNCPICNAEFKNIGHWTTHISSNHDFFRPSHVALTMTLMPTRIKRKRRSRPYCLKCDRPLDAFRGFRCLWVEQLRHAPYPAFNCSICPEKFNMLRALLNHFRTNHAINDGTNSTENLKNENANLNH